MSKIKFTDTLNYDSNTKTAISVRDGIQEYLGMEIGKEPYDRVFKIYRSPATIGNTANKMIGLPLTNDHVDFNDSKNVAVGKVVEIELQDFKDNTLGSTLCVKNKISVNDSILELLSKGKRELSLGYEADLVPSQDTNYDFEQKNIIPNHLAVVDAARGGESCRFIDKKGVIKMVKKTSILDSLKALIASENKNAVKFSDKKSKFTDAEEGATEADAENTSVGITMEELADLLAKVENGVKNMTLPEIMKYVPALQEIAGYAEESRDEDDLEDALEEAQEDKELSVAVDTDKLEVKDSKPFKAFKSKKTFFSDSDVKKVVRAQLLDHNKTLVKAQRFLDSSYDFSSKDTEQIKYDTVYQATGKKYKDIEKLNIAFDVLQEPKVEYKNFIDAKLSNGFEEVAEYDLGLKGNK